MAHNPEVEGSNPSPATKARGPLSNRERAFCMWFVHGFVHGRLLKPFCSSQALTPSDLHRGQGTADDQLRQGGSDLPVGFQVGLAILLHGERDI
jgi:hypothetical protein